MLGMTSPVTAEEIDSFQRDGAICLRGKFNNELIERMQNAIERIKSAPSKDYGFNLGTKEHKGEFFNDLYMWMRDEDFRNIGLHSPAAEIVGRLMKSQRANLFYDQLLVKEPGAEAPTPWHHDLTYWCVAGHQVSSVWIAFDPVDSLSGQVEFIRGSHLWGTEFDPADFAEFKKKGLFNSGGLPAVPDIESCRSDYDIISWDLEPGDCLVFHSLTMHHSAANQTTDRRRRGLSIRYTGDDAVYYDRPGSSKPPLPHGLQDGDPISGDVFPLAWQNVNH